MKKKDLCLLYLLSLRLSLFTVKRVSIRMFVEQLLSHVFLRWIGFVDDIFINIEICAYGVWCNGDSVPWNLGIYFFFFLPPSSLSSSYFRWQFSSSHSCSVYWIIHLFSYWIWFGDRIYIYIYMHSALGLIIPSSLWILDICDAQIENSFFFTLFRFSLSSLWHLHLFCTCWTDRSIHLTCIFIISCSLQLDLHNVM